ncbi:MAG: nucleotide-binding protein [Deltaproteobacteria bacterium]|nr:nucleotide-binding protein [Deltaproteobacteria bacterium]
MRSKLKCLVLVAALGACGCKTTGPTGGGPGPRPGDDQRPPSAGPPSGRGTKATVSGQVLETLDADGRTYLRIVWSGRERWVAVPTAKVKVGDVVSVHDGVELQTFTSKTLNRTFERILLGQLGPAPASAPAGTGALPPGHPPVPASLPGEAAGKAPPHPPVAPPVKMADLKVPRATGPEGRTVAGVFADSARLKDKSVVVNGVVVKLNTGIMNRNWVHLGDGTGSADQKDHDLVVTTTDTVKVGDKVKVSGTVRKDKDFGFGYKYATMVEDAKVEPLK